MLSVAECAVTVGPARQVQVRARAGMRITLSATRATSSVIKASPVLCVEGPTALPRIARWFSVIAAKGKTQLFLYKKLKSIQDS